MRGTGYRPARAAALALVAACVFAVHPPLRAQTGGGAPALAGAIDVHVHALPDDRPRSIDAVEAARQARDRGMRGIVLKNHYESTAGIASLVRALVPGVEVFGGIDLNLTVGGINPAAVEHMTRVTGGWGRVVWMPTFDAENQVRFSKEKRPFVRIATDGQLLPEVKQVIALIAKHGLILATGHSSPEESLLLLREARNQNVQRAVVTHAINPAVGMSVPQMQQAAQLGAFIEFVGSSPVTADAAVRYDRTAEAIRAVGTQHCILSSDLGQMGNPQPADGFGAFLAAMRTRGFTQEEIQLMAARNPGRLLGLP